MTPPPPPATATATAPTKPTLTDKLADDPSAPFAWIVNGTVRSRHPTIGSAKGARTRGGGIGDVVELLPPTAPIKTNAKKKAAKKPAATNKTTTKPTNTSGGGVASGGRLLDIPLARITANPHNPRQHFDDKKLQDLADSLKKHGQLQPCVVRVAPGSKPADKRYELIAGERRWRASKLAKLPFVRAELIDVTDTQAIELAGLENLDRDDLNVIEEARWLRSMTQDAGFSQRDLAKRIGKTQPFVAQRLALLKLSGNWQDSLITGVITIRDSRVLMPWIDHAGVMVQARKWVLDAVSSNESFDLEYIVGQAAMKHSCSMTCVKFKVTKKRRDELNIKPVYNGWTQEDRAFNTDLWGRLQAEAESKAKAAAASPPRLTTPNSEPKNGKASTPAQSAGPSDAERRERAADILANRIKSYKTDWLQARIVDHLAGDPLLHHVARIHLFFALKPGNWRNGEHAVKSIDPAGGKVPGGHSWTTNYLGGVISLKGDQLDDAVLNLVRHRCGINWQQSDSCLYAREVHEIADLLGIDLAAEWTPDADYLALHTNAQLADLAKEWKLDPPTGKRQAQLDDLLARAQAANAKAPKALQKAKP